MKTGTAQESSRLLGNMSRMAGYRGTTTADVVDYMCEHYSMTVFCYGELRNIVFTPITSKLFAFKTEAALTQASESAPAQDSQPVAWRIWSPDGANVYQYTEDGDGEPLYASPQPQPSESEVVKLLRRMLHEPYVWISKWLLQIDEVLASSPDATPEQLYAKGWQAINCPACGCDGAQAFKPMPVPETVLTDADVSEIIRSVDMACTQVQYIRVIEAAVLKGVRV